MNSNDPTHAPLTLLDILFETDTAKKPSISYTGAVLTEESKRHLLEVCSQFFTDEELSWEMVAHHMTICMGSYKKEPREQVVGQRVHLVATEFAKNNLVAAVKIDLNQSSQQLTTTNKTPHITVAVNRADGGKPMMSNQLIDWVPLAKPLVLEAVVEEVPNVT